MTPEKILEAAETYRRHFLELGIPAESFPHDEILHSELPEEQLRALCHCHGMIDGIVDFVGQGRLEKAQRWLCFIQGVLFAQGHFTIGDLKNHNRPDESK